MGPCRDCPWGHRWNDRHGVALDSRLDMDVLMSHYIYFKRKGGPIVVQDVVSGNQRRAQSVYIDGPSEIIWNENNPDLDVSVYCLTDAMLVLVDTE